MVQSGQLRQLYGWLTVGLPSEMVGFQCSFIIFPFNMVFQIYWFTACTGSTWKLPQTNSIQTEEAPLNWLWLFFSKITCSLQMLIHHMKRNTYYIRIIYKYREIFQEIHVSQMFDTCLMQGLGFVFITLHGLLVFAKGFAFCLFIKGRPKSVRQLGIFKQKDTIKSGWNGSNPFFPSEMQDHIQKVKAKQLVPYQFDVKGYGTGC